MKPQKMTVIFISIFFIFFLAFNIYAAEVSVINVHDGDTVTLKSKNGRKIKIRLFGIDAPELAQNYGEASRRHLFALIKDKKISYKTEYKDTYGRTVAELFADNRSVNVAMVENGYAWHYKHFSKSQKLAKAELTARKNHYGLWKDANPTPPWDFRKKQKELPNVHNKPLFKIPIKGVYMCVDPETFDSKIQMTPCPKGLYTVFGEK